MTQRSAAPGSHVTLSTSNALARCDQRLVSLLRPDSLEAEQFRCLRYSLLRTLTGRRCNVIAISSAERGNGRTTTAVNLAAALEETGIFRVLLLTADLPGSAVCRRLALSSS